jgi:tetratricopeptide (TPR) repeat protein
MDCPPPVEALATFTRANQEWFWEGRTHQAAALYEQAAHLGSGDPVILFQSARVQWALGRVDAARSTLEKALSQSNRLSQLGVDRLAKFKGQLTRGAHARLPGRVRPDDLDVDRLGQTSLTPAEWHELATAAEERGAYGVAFFARDRAKGPITVIDEEKEQWELTKKAESELALLDSMRECKDGP